VADTRLVRLGTADLDRDQDAVTAGVTLPWSSGMVEGRVNRLKMLKRQMSAAPNPDLCANACCSSSNPDRSIR
jgi:transposase